MRVLRSFKFSGVPSPRPEVFQLIFELCKYGSVGDDDIPEATSSSFKAKYHQKEPAADPSYLLTLLFGEDPKGRRAPVINVSRTKESAEEVVKEAPDGRRKSYSDRLNQRRPSVGRGPLNRGVLSDFELNVEQHSSPTRRSSIEAIPLRFVSRKTYNSLAAPSDFDVSVWKRSSQPPPYTCVR